MRRPKGPQSASRSTARDHARPDEAALARTLEKALTRAATRSPGPATPRPAAQNLAAQRPAEDGIPPGIAVAAPAAHTWRIGWATLLALLNVVLSGFILMLWGVPRWGAPTSSGPAPSRMAATPSVSPQPAQSRPAESRQAVPPSTSARPIPPPSSRPAPPPAPTRTASSAPPEPLAAAGPSTPLVPPAPPVPPASGVGSVLPRRADDRGVPAMPGAVTPLTSMPGQAVRGATPPPIAANASPPTAPGSDRAGAGAAGAASLPTAGEGGVTMPERLPESYVRPTIAALAGGEPVTGEIRLRGTVRVDGSVQDLEVVSSSRPGVGLEQAALAAVSRWRYKPATRDGQSVDARLTITVTFR